MSMQILFKFKPASSLKTTVLHMLRIKLTLILIVFFPTIASAASYGDFVYEESGGNVIITRYTGPGGELVIPGMILGKPVVALGENAFRHYATLTTIVIPNTVRTIGQKCFESCIALTNVNI